MAVRMVMAVMKVMAVREVTVVREVIVLIVTILMVMMMSVGIMVIDVMRPPTIYQTSLSHVLSTLTHLFTPILLPALRKKGTIFLILKVVKVKRKEVVQSYAGSTELC